MFSIIVNLLIILTFLDPQTKSTNDWELKSNKSPGPDSLPPKILKETASAVQVCVPLTIIFKKSLYVLLMPDDWKSANVVSTLCLFMHKKVNATALETIVL